MQRIFTIQYLRGFAAIMVVAFHAFPVNYALIGAAGTDVFFVISGFIMWVITDSRETAPADFLYHRIIRVVPLYWIFTLVLAVSAVTFPRSFPNLQLTLDHMLLSLTFIPHFVPSTSQILPLLAQGWTLNYEMLFYLLVATALLLPKNLQAIAIFAMLLALVLLGIGVPDNAAPPFQVCTNLLLLEFAAGLGIGILWTRGKLDLRSLVYGPALVVISLAAFLLAAIYGKQAEQFRVLTWGGPSCLLVLGMLIMEAQKRMINLTAWLLIGDASYSIYLSHGMVISALHKFTDFELFDKTLRSSPTTCLIITAIATIVGILIYWTIELPLLTLLRRQKLRPKIA